MRLLQPLTRRVCLQRLKEPKIPACSVSSSSLCSVVSTLWCVMITAASLTSESKVGYMVHHMDGDMTCRYECVASPHAGIDASVSVQTKETEVFARLRDILVTDVDPKTIHKKVRTP